MPSSMLSRQGIAYPPFFPLGGFSRCGHQCSSGSAGSLQATPMQVALPRFSQRSPNILLIPGTSSIKHLRKSWCVMLGPYAHNRRARWNSQKSPTAAP